MSNPNLYQELKEKAITAAAKRTKDVPNHGPEHIFILGLFLFFLSIFLFWVLNVGELNGGFLGFNNSSGKLVKGLFQLFSLQLLFLSLAVFYRAFIECTLKEKPDDFVERIVDAIKKHLNPDKDVKEKDDKSINAQSSLWVSLVLAITVNITVSVSNYFEQIKPNTEIADRLTKIEVNIDDERAAYKEMQGKLNAELSSSKDRLNLVEAQILEQSSTHNSALKIIGDATSALNQSIRNFDGISLHNSFPESNSTDSSGVVKIENKVNIRNPDNTVILEEMDKKIQVANGKNTEIHLSLMNSVTNFLCLQHEGFYSWAKKYVSEDERRNRLACENFKNEMKRLSELNESKNDQFTTNVVGHP